MDEEQEHLPFEEEHFRPSKQPDLPFDTVSHVTRDGGQLRSAASGKHLVR